MAFWRQFGGCTLTYGDLCWPAGLEATRLTYGANLHNHPRHTADSRFILLWGHNPAETNVHQMRWILDAQERGAVVALIDPRSTDTTDAADIHLQPRPGTDAALALGMARVIVDAGLHDAAFLERTRTGFERYLERLRDYPLDARRGDHRASSGRRSRASRSTTRAHKPALLIAGFGLQRHHRAGPDDAGRGAAAGADRQRRRRGRRVAVRQPDQPLPAAIRRCRPSRRGVRRAIPVSRLARRSRSSTRPPIRAAWIEKGNPASQNPRSRPACATALRAARPGRRRRSVHDRHGAAGALRPARPRRCSRRRTSSRPTGIRTCSWRAKLWDPPGEVKPETEIWRLLCERFGFDTRYFPQGDAETRALLRGCCPRRLMLRRPPRPLRSPVDPTGARRRRVRRPPLPDAVRQDRVRVRRGRRVSGASMRCPTTCRSTRATSRRSPRGFRCSCCRARRATGSTRSSATSTGCASVERPHVLDMHPADAAARGLADGDDAAVWNDRGRIALSRAARRRAPAGRRARARGAVPRGRPRRERADRRGRDRHEPRRDVLRVPRGGGARGRSAGRAPSDRRPSSRRFAANRSRRSAARSRPARRNSAERRSRRWRRTASSSTSAAASAAARACSRAGSRTGGRRRTPGGACSRSICGGAPAGRPTSCRSPATTASSRRAWRRARRAPTRSAPTAMVVHHDDRCIGCRYCEMACPFGAPQLRRGEGRDDEVRLLPAFSGQRITEGERGPGSLAADGPQA